MEGNTREGLVSQVSNPVKEERGVTTISTVGNVINGCDELFAVAYLGHRRDEMREDKNRLDIGRESCRLEGEQASGTGR